MRHTLTTLGLAATLALAACGSLPPAPTPGASLWLLGEVHDNAEAHARRLQRLQQQLDAGARPALLMEQFDRERQPDIDRLLQRPTGTTGAADEALIDRLVALGGGTAGGWDWALYRPVLRLALQYRLPLVAANVSRADSRAVMRQGLAATGFDAAVPADLQQAQAQAIEASHCGQLDATQAGRMALAQVARDQFMARQLVARAGRGAVLLAGNGHVRRDVGVPRWLPPALRAQARVVGHVEPGDPSATAYDEVVVAPAQPRGDPCAGMRGQTPATTPAATPAQP